MKDDRVYLEHILECLEAVRGYVDSGRESLNDRRTQKAVLRELQEMAESTQHLSAALKASQPSIPWKDIAGFRNVLVHDYLGINIARIWEAVERDLPPLQAAVRAMLATLGPKGRQDNDAGT